MSFVTKSNQGVNRGDHAINTTVFLWLNAVVSRRSRNHKQSFLIYQKELTNVSISFYHQSILWKFLCVSKGFFLRFPVIFGFEEVTKTSCVSTCWKRTHTMEKKKWAVKVAAAVPTLFNTRPVSAKPSIIRCELGRSFKASRVQQPSWTSFPVSGRKWGRAICCIASK